MGHPSRVVSIDSGTVSLLREHGARQFAEQSKAASKPGSTDDWRPSSRLSVP